MAPFFDSNELYLDVALRTVVTCFCTVSANALLVWEWATHLEEEVEYIWRRDWKMAGKPLYLFVRYFGFAFQLFDLIQMMAPWGVKFCTAYYILLPIGTPFFLFTVDVILAYRTMCLYRMNRRLLYFNVVFVAGCIIATTVIAGVSFAQFGVISTPQYLTGCWATMPATIYMTTLPPLLFELWLFGLVLYKLWTYQKEYGSLSRTSLVQLLLQDSMSWFFIIAAVILWNGLNLALAPEGLRGVALPFFRTFVIIGGCRLIVHMREQMLRPDDYTVATAIDIDFNTESRDQTGTWDSSARNKYRVMTFARRIGLPPASHRLESMWPDNETAIGTRMFEMTDAEPEPASRSAEPPEPPAVQLGVAGPSRSQVHAESRPASRTSPLHNKVEASESDPELDDEEAGLPYR